MSTCKIFPEIYNNKGELVESQLFKDALNSGLDRDAALKEYSRVRYPQYLKENGNWLLYKDLQSGRVSTVNKYLTEDNAKDALQEFKQTYGEDFVDDVISIIEAGPITYYGVKLQSISAGDIKVKLDSNGEPIFNLKDNNEVSYNLKSLSILQSDKGKQVFDKGAKNGWSLDKILNELQLPKEQKELILDLGLTNREDIILELASNYSYTIKIDTTKRDTSYDEKLVLLSSLTTEEILQKNNDLLAIEPFGLSNTQEQQLINIDNYLKYNVDAEIYIKDNSKNNTDFYANLAVPGGTNYTENEISTPAIIPSIKGHAQFSTDKGIGWFRNDDKTITEKSANKVAMNAFGLEDENESSILKQVGVSKTLRILEVQSDLFQKGRDRNDLTGTYSENVEGVGEMVGLEERESDPKANQFLQLLNKDNNWVTFFIKSIIQDSAKKGYEKVLFPTGNTASKVEGHTTLEEFKKQKEDRIKELEDEIKNIPSQPEYDEDGILLGDYSEGEILPREEEINQLKQELKRVETEGFGALKPIYNFYENTVTNILKKQGFNPVVITDEYGNTWNEVNINSKSLETIQFQKRQSQEEKFFRTTVGLIKNQGNGSYRAKVNSNVENFNKKYGTSHYVNWNQMGQSDLFKITDITYRWNNFGQGTLFQKEATVSEDSNQLIEVLELLSSQLPIDYTEISQENSSELLKDNYNGEPAFFYKGRVYLVTGKANMESAFHEFSHPLINQLYLTNKPLFDKLYIELEKVDSNVITNVNTLYPENSSEDNRKEALVTFLGKVGQEKYKEDKSKQSLGKKLLLALKRLINRLLGREVNLDKLSANTTLSEFSDLIGLKSTKKVKLNKTLSSANKVEFQKVNPVTKELRELIDKTEATIANQIAIYKSKTAQNTSKSDGLLKLEEVLEKVKAVSDTAEYLDAINTLLPILDSTEAKLTKLAERGNFTKKDASFLKSTEEFLSSMGFLDELAILITRKKIVLETDDPFSRIINDAITKKQSLQTIYKELSLDYLSELLFNEIDPSLIEESVEKKKVMLAKNPNDSRARLIITSKEDMRKHLQEASKDIKAQNLWLYSAASSNDPALSLGALYVKRNLEQAADDTYLIAQQMNLALEAFKLKNKANIDNPAEFNKDIIEEIQDILYVKNEETGETVPQIIRRLAFVGEFDISSFNASYLAMKKAQNEAVDENAAKKAFRLWAEQNIEFKTGWQDIIEAKAAKYGGKDTQGFKDWESDNIFYFRDQFGNITKSVPKFGKDLWQPKRELYTNSKYEALLNKPDALEYRNILVDVLSKHQEKLPETMKLKLKPTNFSDALIVPSRYKTKRERVLDKQFKELGEDIKSEFKIDTEREQTFGLVKLDGEPFYGIPIHHTQNMNIDDVSRDVFTNVLYFVDSVNKRQGLQKTEAEMLLLKDLLNTRKIEKTTESGETVYNAFLKKTPQQETVGGNSARKFNEFIDTIFYGRSVVEAGNIFGKFSINQTVDKLIGLASVTQLAFNLPAAAANKINGEVMNLSNTIGGRYWSIKDYGKAQGDYDLKYLTSSMADMSKGMPETLESRIMMIFDPIQGSFKDVKGRTISQSNLLREFRRDHLFFLNNIGEHSIQVKNMLAMMHGYKVTNEAGEQLSLADAIVDVKDARFILKEGYSISDQEVVRLRNKLHRVNQKLHGNYSNSVDRVMLQRYWYGRLALLFRKFIVPGMQRRWDVEHLDFETGEFERGIYRDAYEVFLTEVVGRAKALFEKTAMEEKAPRTPLEEKIWRRQKASAFQTLFEFGLFLMTIFLGAAMIDEDDEEKDSWGAYTTALLLRRLQGDLSFYFNPLEFLNMVKNPTVSISYIQSVITFVLNLLFLWGEDRYYDRQVGVFEKGSSKTYAKFLKIVPLLRPIINLQSPEEQLKFYNLLSI